MMMKILGTVALVVIAGFCLGIGALAAADPEGRGGKIALRLIIVACACAAAIPILWSI